MATKVRALRDGFHGTRRRAGDVFYLTDGYKPGKWMEVVGAAPAKAEAPAKTAPGKAFGGGKAAKAAPTDSDLA